MANDIKDLKSELKREMKAAVSILLPSKQVDPKTKSVALAVLKLAALVRRAHKRRKLNLTRSELRKFLEETRMLSVGLSRKLGEEILANVLQQSIIVHADAGSWAATERTLEGAEATRIYLSALSAAVTNALGSLELSGRSGSSGPFQRSQVPPEALIAIYARQIFVDFGLTTRRPATKENFQRFLELVWFLAIPKAGGVDWSTPVKIAKATRTAGISCSAILQTRLQARDFTRNLVQQMRGTEIRAAQIRGLQSH